MIITAISFLFPHTVHHRRVRQHHAGSGGPIRALHSSEDAQRDLAAGQRAVLLRTDQRHLGKGAASAVNLDNSWKTKTQKIRCQSLQTITIEIYINFINTMLINHPSCLQVTCLLLSWAQSSGTAPTERRTGEAVSSCPPWRRTSRTTTWQSRRR